jgi:nitrogenase molybdenum-iron protein alpha/beta subunit
LEGIGIKLNCSYPGCGDAGDIQHLTAAKYNLMLNPDRFTKQLCQQLKDDFGIPCLKNIVRPGLSGLRAWLGEVAEVFGKQKEFEAYMKMVESEYAESAKTIPATLRGKTVCILSITKDVEWLIEGALSAGMEILDVTVLNRTYYSNDLDLPTKYPFIKIVEEDDLVKAVNNVATIGADIVLSSARLPRDIVQVPIPMVQEDDPFFAVRYFTKIARRLMAPAEPGWREDVVRP